jgi:tRNA/tmRNA/rRNA uracil-C5-methylase (TrmA/RlmC/RlmD family)
MNTDALLIDDLAYGGKGVARLGDGKVCFIPGVAPGETVQASISKDRDSFVEAHLVQVLDPSPHRILPACPLAAGGQAGLSPFLLASDGRCPGCTYQHLAYGEEVRIKQSQLRDLLVRQADCGAEALLPPQPAPSPLGYRNKMTLHAQKDGRNTRLGYVAEDNQTVLDVAACPIACPPVNECLARLLDQPSFLHGLRDGMPVTFRWTEHNGAVWWRGAAGRRESWLVESTPLGPLSVPRDSFFQVNPAVSALLLSHVMEHLASCRPETVVDLYCGVGLFALAAARTGAPDVTGIDLDGPGIEAAIYNARQMGLPAIRWVAGPAQRAISALESFRTGRKSLLMVDPPRAGLGRALVQDILHHPPERLLYISCAPDTMARDIAWLKAGGYTLEQARLFDMFPRTPHFETVAALKRA